MSERITVIRAPRDRDHAYFAISRALAQDTRLSYEARGVLAYLLSKPSDWEAQVPDLMREGHTGRERMYRILRELREAGYIHRERTRLANGTFEWGPYRVFEVPHAENPHMDGGQHKAEQPHAENPHMDNPYTENPHMDLGDLARQDAKQPYTGLPYTENQHILHIREDTNKREKKREGAQAPTPAPAPAAASLNGKKPTTDPNQTHPASLVYLEVTGYRPERASAARIAQCIPREPQALEVWRTVVETWITSGSRRGNVDGMIDRYNAKGITNAAQKHNHGQRDQRRAQPSADRAPVRAFDLEHDI